MEKALLVTIKLRAERDEWPMEDIAEELEELTRSTGVEIVDNVMAMVDRPNPALFIGKGKADEISLRALDEEVDTVIFSHDLSGTQQRNLEEVIGRKTIDRTQLILDIFAKHAKSPEGKTQVELAQLQYLLPRLTGKGLILSQQGAGIGTSGPGEKKLEMDRRRIRKKIDALKDELRHMRLHRETMRKRRKENRIPMVALVGYTNAGKSTLLNTLTDAGQRVHDGLFTTLDPLSKSMKLPNGETVVVSDTVGFLYDLPHHLIEAFKATLEEVTESDLLLHVLDISNPKAGEHYRAVMTVLGELGLTEGENKKKIVTVLNKIDRVEDRVLLNVIARDYPDSVQISALTGRNVDALLERIEEFFASRTVCAEVKIPHKRMDLVNFFYEKGKVQNVEYLQTSIKLNICLPKAIFLKISQDPDVRLSDKS
ncbi:MAG: GTPase HflX [Deltaproteobacteria bacterium]